MSDQHGGPQRLFTVDQANAMLPLVRAIVSDLVILARDVSDRWERLSFLVMGRESLDCGDPYAEELVQVGLELERDHRRLREYADELIELGVEPKSAIEGVVDFPAVVDGQIVRLCWKLGEPNILFFHDADAGYEDRRRLKSGESVGVSQAGAMASV